MKLRHKVTRFDVVAEPPFKNAAMVVARSEDRNVAIRYIKDLRRTQGEVVKKHRWTYTLLEVQETTWEIRVS